jgi:hypothetical protein
MMKKLLLITLLSTSLSALAEYRVYQFVVTNKIKIENSPKGHMVTSTLDPISYVSYHGGESLLAVDLLRTWVCPGHTAHKEICQSPYGRLPDGVKL